MAINQGVILKKLIREAGYTQQEFADKIEVTRGYIQQLVSKSKLTEDVINDMSKFLDVDKNIFYGESESTVHSQNGKSKSGIFKLAGAPYYDIDATAGDVTVFQGETSEEIKAFINIPSFHSCKAFINVKGHSMYPKYQSGDIIGLIPVNDISIIQYGEAYLIITKDSQRMVKTIRKHADREYITLHNENEKFDDFELPLNKLDKLFLIKGPIRDGVMG